MTDRSNGRPQKRGSVSPTAIGVTHPGLADALETGVLHLIVKDLADRNVKRWADVFIPMEIQPAYQGRALVAGEHLEAAAPLYGIRPERVKVIGRTTIDYPTGETLFLIVDASGQPAVTAERDG